MISEIKSDIEEIEAETSIYEPANFNARTDAIDFIDFHIIDRIEALIQQVGHNDELIKLRKYINSLKGKLEDIDADKIAKTVKVPVRAINSDASPTNIENNLKSIEDYNYKTIIGTGHYPMLEKPDEFNSILSHLIKEFVAD